MIDLKRHALQIKLARELLENSFEDLKNVPRFRSFWKESDRFELLKDLKEMIQLTMECAKLEELDAKTDHELCPDCYLVEGSCSKHVARDVAAGRKKGTL